MQHVSRYWEEAIWTFIKSRRYGRKHSIYQLAGNERGCCLLWQQVQLAVYLGLVGLSPESWALPPFPLGAMGHSSGSGWCTGPDVSYMIHCQSLQIWPLVVAW